MIKFPKTPRIVNVLQDEDIYKNWKHFHAVIEEKADGANAGISFKDNELLLQSRGHYLRGGPRERQFDLLKKWARDYETDLYCVLEDKYVLFGEWMYAKHHIFYDNLPHYFLAYDLYDKTEGKFLSYWRFIEKIKNSVICMVPVLFLGKFDKINNFTQHIKTTSLKTDKWKDKLIKLAGEKEFKHTDMTDLMEGIYVRIENDDWVVGRMKHPRVEFTKVISDDSHWMTRPIITNLLKDGVII